MDWDNHPWAQWEEVVVVVVDYMAVREHDTVVRQGVGRHLHSLDTTVGCSLCFCVCMFFEMIVCDFSFSYCVRLS